jgi:hypothetical protein
MKRDRTNIEGLCDALNQIGIRTTIPGGTEAKPKEKQTSRSVEKARRRAVKEISRISGNAKRLISR